ncbi:MAG TPA: toxin TcdB middle/N-terminal domain-containing protein, partial [Planctomycetota bacterium]|nr:toxin TcdB middle/N-terminal domain-containing protein [Planctomycetota bacterium]
DAPIVLPLGVSLSPQDVARAGFADVDGDGVVDLTVVRPSSAPSGVLYWLSRFQNGLEGPRLITGLPPQSNEDALRWADMNASGSTDIVISRPRAAAGERIVFVELVPQGKPHLLRRADNGLGQVMTIEYEPSSAQMTRAHAAGNPWTLRMPLSVTVVGRIREDDGRGTVSERVITYRDPFWDAEKQEFRGFTVADALEVGDSSAAGKLTRTEFHIGLDADCLKGKPRAEEVRGEEGELYTRTENDWDHRVLAAGDDGREVCFAFQSGFEELVVEGGISGVVLSTELEHDDFGNVIAERRHGIAEEAGDEIFISREYEIRVPAWRLDLLSREVVSDGDGEVVAERRFFYDERGNLVRREAWLDTDGRFVPELRQSYDDFGNIVEI